MEQPPVRVEEVLNSFAEVMSALMIDQYQKHISELDLTLAQAQALRILRRGPVTTGHLACELRISAPAITQLTDRLIRKGLIERSAAADDRRCVIVTLSAHGRELVDQFRRRRRDVFSRALEHLNQDEQARIIEVLVKVVGALESLEAKDCAETQSAKLNSTGKKQKNRQLVKGGVNREQSLPGAGGK